MRGQIAQDQQATQPGEVAKSLPAALADEPLSRTGLTLPGHHKPPARRARLGQFRKSLYPPQGPHRRRHSHQFARGLPLEAGEHIAAREGEGAAPRVGQPFRSLLTLNRQGLPCPNGGAADLPWRGLPLRRAQGSPVMPYFFMMSISSMRLILNRAGTVFGFY